MSALSTPGGGGTTAQSKPTSGKQKYQKLDINSLYCANRNENSEPSSVKSQLSRKHGMQSLGKVPSARRPPANLPSLKTEIGQDPNSNSISVVATTVSVPPTCTTQTITVTSNNNAAVGPGGWVSLPPPSSPHFRTEFPSLEAAAQPSHRAGDHTGPQPQLRPQTEGSWTCGGTVSGRQEGGPAPAAAPAAVPASQQTPAFRAILPSFLMKGSNGGGGLGLGGLGALRERGGGGGSAPQRDRGPARAPPTPRAVEVLTARPILRDEQISSLDDISRDAGWAQHDDIDYDQKLDFSDGESSAPTKGSTKSSSTRASIESERVEIKVQELGDEDQMWAERRQKQNNEVAQAVARARQRKEEEQRRQLRDVPSSTSQQPKDFRMDRERIDNRERDLDSREKDRVENKNRDRIDRERDRVDKEKERNELRDWDTRDKDRVLENRDRDRMDNRERFDNRDRDLKSERDRDARSDREHEHRDRDRIENRERGRMENRDRHENEKDRLDIRERGDRNERDRTDRDRFDRERERDRDRDTARERNDRDRDFRERNERDYGRDRDQNNPAFSKVFQANIPPRFLKQQQNRQQDDPKAGGWAFSGKPVTRRQDAQPFSAPRHTQHNNGRRSYSRDYSDREDVFRREKEGPGPQWRSEMQDFERFGRDLERSNSKESYKDYSDYKDKRNECDKKSTENIVETNSRSAAEKLSEVFERKSIGISESISSDSLAQTQASVKQNSPAPSSLRESSEREFGKTSWADAVQDEQINIGTQKPPLEKVAVQKEPEKMIKDQPKIEYNDTNHSVQLTKNLSQQSLSSNKGNIIPSIPQTQSQKPETSSSNSQTVMYNQVLSQPGPLPNNTSQPVPNNIQTQISCFPDQQQVLKPSFSAVSKQSSQTENVHGSAMNLPPQKHTPDQQMQTVKPKLLPQKPEKELSESESVASKSSVDPPTKYNESASVDSFQDGTDIPKIIVDDKKNERFLHNEQHIKIPNKEPIERKSSGSGSEKKIRGYGGSGGYAVYNRGWGPRESRGRRSHRSSRSNNRASESDGSTDGALNSERRERRRAPRSPRGPKKSDKPDEINPNVRDQTQTPNDTIENREPFAPRGQPSRRGRGGFQGTSRPPAPAKRVVGYGPPNTKSPFSQANRAVKEQEEAKDNTQIDDKGKTNKPRNGSSSGRGRDRRLKGAPSGEDENWETTSEHSEGGGTSSRRRSAQSQKNNRNANTGNRQNGRSQGGKKELAVENKTTAEITEAISDLKLIVKKDDEVVDDGFQEVRNKKSSKETRPVKEDSQGSGKQSRSHSNQGTGRNQSSTRNSNDKSANRNSAPVPGKSGSQYDRPRQANLAPRFVKQRQQRQQVGSLVSACGPDTGAAPPPPPVNAWDKPISQTLRGNVEENIEVVVENKSAQSSQRSTPAETSTEIKTVPIPCSLSAEKTSMLDGATPPVETIIFENTNYKTATPDEALQQKYQMNPTVPKTQTEEVATEIDNHALTFNGEVRPRPRSIQELMAESGRQSVEGDASSLGLQMSFDSTQKTEDSDMKLDFGFDSDLGQLSEDKSAKSLGLPRGVHMSTSNTISPLAADLNLKIASVKKVWEMPAVAENTEELQFTGFEEPNTESAPPNVCKVKPTQQLQSPPPQHYNHVGYQGGYGGLSVPSPPAMLFNSTQQLLGSSQQLPQQGGLYGAFLDQSRGQFGGFPGTPYGAGSAAPYNYQPPPDMFSSIPSQYRMAAGGGAAFGQSGQLGNSPSTVLISSTSNSLMSATVKPTTQQIGAIGAGSKGGGVGGVGGVNTYGQQYLGYSGPVGEAPYSLLPRPAPPASSYYSPYQPPTAPAPTYPLQFTQPAQSGAFGSQFLSSQLQVAAAVQQMQQQYRAPLQQQYPPPQPQPRLPPQQQLKSPLHEHANGFAPLCDAASPTPKGGGKPQKPPHSPPQHKYHAPPQHPPPAHTPHQHHQQQMVSGGGNTVRCVGGGVMARGGGPAPRYPAPIQRPHAPALPLYRAPQQRPHQPRPNLYYHHPHRNGGGGNERAPSVTEGSGGGCEESGEPAPAAEVQPPPELKAE